MVDIDDTIVEVHGYAKQGSGYGYSGARGLNAVDHHGHHRWCGTGHRRPVVTLRRLRIRAWGGPDGRRHPGQTGPPTIAAVDDKAAAAADSAFYGYPAAIRGGAQVSITVRLDPKVRAAIAAIDDDAWTPIEYSDAVYDEGTSQWISRAEVAEIGFTSFSSKKRSEHVEGRLVVRRIPDLNSTNDGQATLFDVRRFHAFLTTTDLDTITADTTHRGHAIIEQVHADLKNSLWPTSAAHHLTQRFPIAPQPENPTGSTRHRGRAINHAHPTPPTDPSRTIESTPDPESIGGSRLSSRSFDTRGGTARVTSHLHARHVRAQANRLIHVRLRWRAGCDAKRVAGWVEEHKPPLVWLRGCQRRAGSFSALLTRGQVSVGGKVEVNDGRARPRWGDMRFNPLSDECETTRDADAGTVLVAPQQATTQQVEIEAG